MCFYIEIKVGSMSTEAQGPLYPGLWDVAVLNHWLKWWHFVAAPVPGIVDKNTTGKSVRK